MWSLQFALTVVAFLPFCQLAILRGAGDFKPGHEGECFLDNINIYMKVNDSKPIIGCQEAHCSEGSEPGTYFYEMYTCGVISHGSRLVKKVPGDRFAVYPDCCDKFVPI
ncbi:uncharacterized protein LOC122391542 [Amphibalanus amphitrite]|uniref:uncharacterized protein LOC122368995 n=1 Tax=Amphibalanus amphitrite TaxID=1232801 RepID=UPI001C901965|nr:uncharacterized protein LOC122368995 [Amphibalanus amphitrite]XP_043241514.1 uncharacterized protein LOC122391542 [Amphibalanus amphitrite]